MFVYVHILTDANPFSEMDFMKETKYNALIDTHWIASTIIGLDWQQTYFNSSYYSII